MLIHFQGAITILTNEIQQLTEQHFPSQIQRLKSIVGISTTIATALIDVTAPAARGWLPSVSFGEGIG
jgi:transposase